VREGLLGSSGPEVGLSSCGIRGNGRFF
jgi:hypothetical protein